MLLEIKRVAEGISEQMTSQLSQNYRFFHSVGTRGAESRTSLSLRVLVFSAPE